MHNHATFKPFLTKDNSIVLIFKFSTVMEVEHVSQDDMSEAFEDENSENNVAEIQQNIVETQADCENKFRLLLLRGEKSVSYLKWYKKRVKFYGFLKFIICKGQDNVYRQHQWLSLNMSNIFKITYLIEIINYVWVIHGFLKAI